MQGEARAEQPAIEVGGLRNTEEGAAQIAAEVQEGNRIEVVIEAEGGAVDPVVAGCVYLGGAKLGVETCLGLGAEGDGESAEEQEGERAQIAEVCGHR